MMVVFNKVILFPPEQVEIYVGTVELPVGATQDDTQKVVKEVTKNIISKTGNSIKHIISRAGTNRTNIFDPKGQDADNVGCFLMYVNEETQNT